jgi:hypothetical protein
MDQVAIDVETGLPDGSCLLEELLREPNAVRALEVIILGAVDGFEEPLALSPSPGLGERVGAALRAAASTHAGQAFRVGGTVYAVLLPPEVAPGAVASTVRATLLLEAAEQLEGLVHGRVTVPLEVPPGREAVRTALARARGRVGAHPRSTARQVRDVLLRLLEERAVPGGRMRRREVVHHAVALGRQLGMGTEDIDHLVRATELQDVGMLALDSSVLRKSAPLTPEDWALIAHHPIVGDRVLSVAPAMAPIARIVRSCYERWDGTGYPDRRRGDDIPLSARIIAVCVAYDAMRSARPYRPALTVEEALRELCRCAGTQFDPRVVTVFLALAGGSEAPAALAVA